MLIGVWILIAAPLVVIILAWLSLSSIQRTRRSQSKTATVGHNGNIAASGPPQHFPDPVSPPVSGLAPSNGERAVRVFVSSTFKDMHDERDMLVRTTFPALAARFRARGIEFLAVDLRWGVTIDDQAQKMTLPICLREIDRCRPYFIGLLGERYGARLSEADAPGELQTEFHGSARQRWQEHDRDRDYARPFWGAALAMRFSSSEIAAGSTR
jgi:hypothetical protein